MKPVVEIEINIIGEKTRIEGRTQFDQTTRVHGVLIGEIESKPGSTLILSETSVVEGNIHADTVFIDGYVRGDVHATTRVVISGTGRVVGNIVTPSLKVDFGAYFEGGCRMETIGIPITAAAATSAASPS